jgi:hypothetical protein
MAAIPLMIGGAIVNALAFSGSNYLFSKIGHEDSQAEMKRYHEAVERLQAAQAAWSTKRTERLDWLNEEMQRQGSAVKNFQDVDAAMQEYSLVTGERPDPQPMIQDFYTPSEAQKDREITFIILGMGVTGFIAYMLSK